MRNENVCKSGGVDGGLLVNSRPVSTTVRGRVGAPTGSVTMVLACKGDSVILVCK